MLGHVRSKLECRRGSTFTDYLLMTAVVAGVAFPLVMTFLGGPLMDSLLGQRQQLVSFLAQDRKQNVPSSWFSQEEMGGKDPGQVAEPKGLSDPDVVEPGQIKQTKRFRNPNLKQPGRLAANNAAQPGQLREPGQVSVGGGGGGTGGGGGGGSSDLNPDFFNPNNQTTPGGKPPENQSGGSAYGKGGGGSGESASGSGNGGGEAGEKIKKGQPQDDNAQKGGTPGETRRQMLEGLARAEAEQDARKSAFNWFLLLKFIVFLLIVFLVLLIALGNMRRR